MNIQQMKLARHQLFSLLNAIFEQSRWREEAVELVIHQPSEFESSKNWICLTKMFGKKHQSIFSPMVVKNGYRESMKSLVPGHILGGSSQFVSR